MSEKQTSPFQPSKRARVVTAVGAAAGLLLGSGAVSDHAERNRLPIYQPADMQPTFGGSEVPDGFQAPVGETRTPVPGRPDQVLVQYGRTPDGQTLPDRIVPAPPVTTPPPSNMAP